MVGQRTSFHFSREAGEQLTAIRSRTILSNNADVIRAALSAYDTLLRLEEEGLEFVIIVEDGAEYAYSPYKKCAYPGFDDQLLKGNPLEKVARNFFFSKESVSHLEAIRDRSFVSSNADAIRVSLTAYRELLIIEELGDRLVVRDSDGNEAAYSPHRPWRGFGASATQGQLERAD